MLPWQLAKKIELKQINRKNTILTKKKKEFFKNRFCISCNVISSIENDLTVLVIPL